MIDVTIFIGSEDGVYYPTKMLNIPSVGEFIELHSYSDMAANLDHKYNLKVLKVIHEVIEFDPDKQSVVKEHHHFVKLICSK